MIVVAGAPEQTLALQLVPPTVPSHFPSDPINPAQIVISPGYEEQDPRAVVQPLPVVLRHVGIQFLQSVSEVRVFSSEHK